MGARNPDIHTRLRRHPELRTTRSPLVLSIGLGVALALLAGWVYVLLNATEISADFASHSDTAVTARQQIGSRFGVQIALVTLPIFAALSFGIAWFAAERFVRRGSAARLRRDYRGYFAGGFAEGEEFQQLLRLRSAAVLGRMDPGLDKGTLMVEAWSAPEDRVGYVGTYVFGLRSDPAWELVEFTGAQWKEYLVSFSPTGSGAFDDAADTPAPAANSAAPGADAPAAAVVPGATPAYSKQLPLIFRATEERRAEARRARRGVLMVAGALIALSVLGLLLSTLGQGRLSLRSAAIVLIALSIAVAVRVFLVSRKADRYLTGDGEMLRLDSTGITISGDTVIPWQAVSGVWANDNGERLHRIAAAKFTGAPKRMMLRTGVSTSQLTIGISDSAATSDPQQRLHRFSQLPSGLTPARIELPFGSHFDSAALQELLQASRECLAPQVPVRLTDDTLDYATAWSGTADDTATIQSREAQRG